MRKSGGLWVIALILLYCCTTQSAVGQASSWTYDIFVAQCQKAGGTVGSSREQYVRGERFVCNQEGASGASKASTDPSCAAEAKINTDWVLSGDKGAQGRYARSKGNGNLPFEALIEAQAHNPNAQASLRRCQAWVENYLASSGETAGGGPQQGAPSSPDCPCISVVPTGESDFEGRRGYRVTNSRCGPLNVIVLFTDATATSLSSRADAGRLVGGQSSLVRAPATYRIPSLSSYGLRNDAGGYTCVCRGASCS